MEIKQNAAFFKIVLLDDYGKDPSERLQPKSLVNLYAPSKGQKNTEASVLFGTSQLLATAKEPPKAVRKLHNQVLHFMRSRDHLVITKPMIHAQLLSLAYTYNFQFMDVVPEILGHMSSANLYVWDIRAMNTVEPWKKEDEGAVKKKTEASSG